MARLFELRATPTDVVLRAAAISFIVFNHTSPIEYAGGMAFLLMLSGMNFARFTIKDGTAPGIRRSILDIARQVFVPSLVVVLLSFAYHGKFNVFELLFIRNWHDSERLSLFPVWYVQMLLQLLAGLYVLTWVPALVVAAVRRPALAMLILFGAGLVIRASGVFVPSPYMIRRLPHTLLWNFALGAVVYFLAVDSTRPRSGRWLAAACVLAGAFVGHEAGTLRFWWLAAGGFLLIGVAYIPLPTAVARIATAVSAAAFAIFLTHMIWFKVVSTIYDVWVPRGSVHPWLLCFFGIALGTLTWAAFVAFGRAYRALQPEPARPVLAQ